MDEWFLAQEIESEESSVVQSSSNGSVSLSSGFESTWKPPPQGWLKCNIGFDWSKRNGLTGAAWVLRNDKGEVLLHSRRAFSRLRTRDEAKLKTVLWAIKSMASHNINQVFFAFQDPELLGAVLRPNAWPSFRYHSLELFGALRVIQVWRFLLEVSSANRGANLIAKSVTSDCRLQSYVATGHPSWLDSVFSNEKV